MPAERAGYSQRSLVEKLGIKAGHRIAFILAPGGFDATLGPLPDRVKRTHVLRSASDVVVFFARTVAALGSRISALKRALAADGMLWICWPKRTSGVDSDLDENIVRETGLIAGLVDVKVCAIDATWSGLKFVYRLKDRPPAITPRRARRTR